MLENLFPYLIYGVPAFFTALFLFFLVRYFVLRKKGRDIDCTSVIVTGTIAGILDALLLGFAVLLMIAVRNM